MCHYDIMMKKLRLLDIFILYLLKCVSQNR